MTIDKDALPAFGWCALKKHLTSPLRYPRKCRWCDGDMSISRNGACGCDRCDLFARAERHR